MVNATPYQLHCNYVPPVQAMCDDRYVGAVVCKMETYSEQSGYIAMLAVDKEYRKRKIGEQFLKILKMILIKLYNLFRIYFGKDDYQANGSTRML